MINVQTSHLVLRSKSFNQLGTNNIRAYMVWVQRYLPNGNMISTSVRIALPVEMTLVCNLKLSDTIINFKSRFSIDCNFKM